jgi:hypothetical protein
MKLKADEILDLLLTEMQKGRSLEDCLEEYPEFAQELEPLLRLAGKIEDLPEPEPSPEAIESVLAKIREIAVSKELKEKKFSLRKIFSLHPVLVRAFAVVLLIIFIGWTSLSFSAKSVPGDVLYPVKLLTEKVQYILTISPEGKAELHLSFADRRTEELVLTFKESEALNKELLSAMLNEAQSALEYLESLTAERSAVLIEKVGKCNQYQKGVLEKIKPMACISDVAVINEAINLCTERHRCIKRILNPESNIEQCLCPCWGTHCNWK